MLEPWDDVLRRFVSASPALLERREMQRRTESKFVMPVPAAAALLPALLRDYALLPAGPDGARASASPLLRHCHGGGAPDEG